MKLRKTLAGILGAVVMLLGVGTFEHVNRETGVHADEEITKTVKIQDYAVLHSWEDSTKYTSLEMDDNITITVSGGSNTGKYYENGYNWRIYENENPEITLTAYNDCTLSSVKFTYTVSNSGVLTFDGVNKSSGTTISLSGSSAVFSVGNTGTKTNGQVRITNVEVKYVSPISSEPHTCVFDKEAVLSSYLDEEATCTSAATYFYSCECGEKGSEKFVYGDPLGHDYDELGFCKRCTEFNTESSYDASIATLFDRYYNDGSYTKETYLNVNSDAIEEIKVYFHAEQVVPYRKTVYEPGKLSMVTANVEGEYDNETLSVYEDNGENVKHTGLGGNWTVNWKSVEDKFVTLKDFKESTITGWTYENGIYSFNLAETTATFEDNMTSMAREFVAPMWLAPNADNYNYVRFTKLTVEEDGAELVMKLFVNSGDASKLIEQSEYLFSQARISKGTTNLATLATFELGANGGTSEATTAKETYTETVNGYTLSLTGGSKMYPNSHDKKENGTIKMGSSSAIGQFTFTVPQDVNKVVINVAGRTKTINIDINGKQYSISTLAENGEYTPIEIDTSSTKNITFKTVETDGEYRCVINSIEYHAK